MAKTPGILNPESFSSERAFEEALEKQGEMAGWTPFDPEAFDEDDKPGR